MNPIFSSRVLQTLRPLMLFLSGAATMGLLITVFEIGSDQPVISRVSRHDKRTSFGTSLQSFPPTSRQSAHSAASSGFLSLLGSPQPSYYAKPITVSSSFPSSPLQPLTSGHEIPTAVIRSDIESLQGSPSSGMSRQQKAAAGDNGLQSFQDWLQTHNVHAQGTLKRDKIAHIAARPENKLRSIQSSHYAVSNVGGGVELTIPPLLHTNGSCTSSICSEYLSKTEKMFFDKCVSKTVAAEKKFGQILNGTCRFTNGAGRYPVALASFPGSGNTWVRGLLEKATGICTALVKIRRKIWKDFTCYYYVTGSLSHLSQASFWFSNSCTDNNARSMSDVTVALYHVQNPSNLYPKLRNLHGSTDSALTGALYCDGGLRTKGFTGEGIRGSSVLVVKDHGAGTPLFTNNKLPKRILDNKPVYGGTVLLVRNPKHCLIAEWHREKSKRQTNRTASNHFLHVGAEYFGNNSHWGSFLQEKAVRWPVHIASWIINGRNNPFHVVRYEDLKMNATREIIKLLKFLGVPHSDQEVDKRLKFGFSDFYRNHHDEFRHFTAEQERFITSQVNQTISILKVYGLDKVFPIHEYL